MQLYSTLTQPSLDSARAVVVLPVDPQLVEEAVGVGRESFGVDPELFLEAHDHSQGNVYEPSA
ncbi:hypothetical protein ACWEJ6_47790 [Nonomuraea sp. NPDC004702]